MCEYFRRHNFLFFLYTSCKWSRFHISDSSFSTPIGLSSGRIYVCLCIFVIFYLLYEYIYFFSVFFVNCSKLRTYKRSRLNFDSVLPNFNSIKNTISKQYQISNDVFETHASIHILNDCHLNCIALSSHVPI